MRSAVAGLLVASLTALGVPFGGGAWSVVARDRPGAPVLGGGFAPISSVMLVDEVGEKEVILGTGTADMGGTVAFEIVPEGDYQLVGLAGDDGARVLCVTVSVEDVSAAAVSVAGRCREGSFFQLGGAAGAVLLAVGAASGGVVYSLPPREGRGRPVALVRAAGSGVALAAGTEAPVRGGSPLAEGQGEAEGDVGTAAPTAAEGGDGEDHGVGEGAADVDSDPDEGIAADVVEEDTVEQQVVDTEKVRLCQDGVELLVGASDVIFYLGQGATLGSCADSTGKVILCQPRGDGPPITISVSQSDAEWYLREGRATLGACAIDSRKVLMCQLRGDGDPPITIRVSEEDAAWYLREGLATLGACPASP